MGERNPSAQYLYEVDRKDVEAYLKKLQAEYAPKTVRDHLKLLNKSFSRHLPVGTSNPFAELVGRRSSKGEGTMHREPFTAKELEKLLDASRDDDFLYPLVVTAACTGMRRGDVCGLRWDAVKLDEGVLEVKTSKTGASVEIPIFGLLGEVLENREQDGDLVFPEAAEMAAKNPDGLT
jgi:integrase